jgi:hypothetical protein
MIRWQHTESCRSAFALARKREMDPDDSLPEDATIVERARTAGAV